MTEKEITHTDQITLMNHHFNIEICKKNLQISELEYKLFVNQLYMRYQLTEADSVGFDGLIQRAAVNDPLATIDQPTQ
jgi:hypothetical protein